MIDPVALSADLIRCRTVTPAEGGALQLLERTLSASGFACWRVDRNGTPNLFARWGEKGAARSFGFNGHTDVVPIGDQTAWSVDPFSAERTDGWLYGRGATDMKSGVAAFVAAAVNHVRQTPPPDDGAILLAVTGDEEGPATDGTTALLDWMSAKGEAMSVCVVGEPTSVDRLGDTIKIGRRGSLSARIDVRGTQGHTAYPQRACNPLPAVAALANRLAGASLDAGSAHFDPSTLALTTIDTGNPATNVIPEAARLGLNIRFNDHHTGADLAAWLEREAQETARATGTRVSVDTTVSGEPFLTPPGPLSELIAAAVRDVTGHGPTFSTSGGTSDARFMRAHCPVVECGLVGHRMHGIDERVWIEDIVGLEAIYRHALSRFFIP